MDSRSSSTVAEKKTSGHAPLKVDWADPIDLIIKTAPRRSPRLQKAASSSKDQSPAKPLYDGEPETSATKKLPRMLRELRNYHPPQKKTDKPNKKDD